MYRTNSQSRAIEEALRKKNIPYKIYGGLSFYKRKEIKDLLSYFRLTINPNDEEALKRVINYPIRGIGKTSIEKALVCAANSDKSLWEIISEPHLYALDANSGTIQKMKDFVTMIQSFATLLKTQDAFELASHIAKSSGLLKDLYDDKTPEGLSRYDNILELLNGVKEFVETNTKKENATPEDTSLPLYMEEISLLTDNIEKKEDEELDTVSLMTIHAAKGLEYPYVFVVGLEENLFPSQLSINSREELEEERRLFYVAVTRSEKKLILTYSTTRYRWGNLIYNEPSRFIEEINPDLIEYKNIALQKTSANDQQKSISSAAPLLKKKNLVKVSPTRNPLFDSVVMEDVMVGVWVEHEKFGKGKVVHMEGDADNKKATVFFQTNGQKQLLLKYAKLRILEEEV